MQIADNNKLRRQLRRFRVGVVGASDTQKAALSRIFSVTQYRVRAYEAVHLPDSRPALKSSVDFVLMCSSDSEVITAWARQADNEQTSARPLVLLCLPGAPVQSRYQLGSPVNPAKLIKMLDQFTIRELNFFPEFEIGSEATELDGAAVRGLDALRSAKNQRQRTAERPVRAMVIEDSLPVRRQLKIEFDLFGAQVDLFDSAEAAMRAIEQDQYDIIFLDVVMPGMDGYAACKNIRRSSANRTTPVVMLTSRSSSFDKIKGTLAGCSAYLVKPVNHNDFEAVYCKYTQERSNKSQTRS